MCLWRSSTMHVGAQIKDSYMDWGPSTWLPERLWADEDGV